MHHEGVLYIEPSLSETTRPIQPLPATDGTALHHTELSQSSTTGVRRGVGSNFRVPKPPGAANGDEFCSPMKTSLHRL